MKIRDVISRKGGQVHGVSPEVTVFDALKMMAEKEIGSVFVLQDGKWIGVLTERDYARKVVLQGKGSRDLLVKEIMSRDVPGISPEEPVEKGLEMMTDKRNRHLPVIENGEILGVVSIGDLVKAIMEKQRNLIQHLENYIKGTA